MRTYVLTHYERCLIKDYIDTGYHPESLHKLVQRCKHHEKGLKEDMELIESLLWRADKK